MDSFTLTPLQKKFYDICADANDNKTCHIIISGAGTGKTWFIRKVSEVKGSFFTDLMLIDEGAFSIKSMLSISERKKIGVVMFTNCDIDSTDKRVKRHFLA